ncbi:zinc finger, CCHC-type containing protein [Tanacetum coccineum]|uniref:Zinc finger, CCHC-type containing protein n=1 Tax=Tanacetum coccineum TaxID=301880 RepID=A0ABQ5ICC8_9ASTR
MEESLRKFMNESAKRHEENSNLIKEIQASTDAAIRNQGASIKALEIQIGQMSKIYPIRRIGSNQYAISAQQNSELIFKPRQATIPFPNCLYDDCCDEKKGSYGLNDLDAYSIRTTLRNDSLPKKEKEPRSFTLPCYINNVCFEKDLAHLGASVSVMPLSNYLNLGLGELTHTKLTIELADIIVKHPKGIAKNELVGIGKFVFPVDFIILDMLEDVNVPLILGRLFLSIAHAKVDVLKRKITLRVGDEKIIFKSVKPASSLIKRVYMLSLRGRMYLDLEARMMGETLILNISFDPLYGDYIELNDLNEPQEHRRNPVDNLKPTIEEGEVVNKPMKDIVKTRCDFVSGLDDYPGDCDFDKRILIDCTYN